MHISCASWYHALQHSKFFVHLTPPPTLDQTVCGFPGNLSSGCTCGTGLLLLRLIVNSRISCRCSRFRAGRRRSRLPRRRALAICLPFIFTGVVVTSIVLSRFHLNDLARSGRRRRQSKRVILGLFCSRGTTARLHCLGWLHGVCCSRRSSDKRVRLGICW
jgi:hypothetical protein